MPNLKISQFTNLASGSQGTSLVIPLAQTDTANFKMTLDALFSDIAYNTADRGIGMIGVATASAPSVSAAGKSKTYYDTTLSKQMLSRSGGAYQQVITGSPSYPLTFTDATGLLKLSSASTTTPTGFTIDNSTGSRSIQLSLGNATPGSDAMTLLLYSQDAPGLTTAPWIYLGREGTGGGAVGSAEVLASINFYNGLPINSLYTGVVLSAHSSGFGSATQFRISTISRNDVTASPVMQIDNWGTAIFAKSIAAQYSSDPNKLVQIGVQNATAVQNASLTINAPASATTWRQLVLQISASQSVNTFEVRNSANTVLTQISQTGILSPGSAAGVDIATSALPFKDLYLAGSSGTPASNNFRVTGTATAARVITLPDATCTLTASASALTSGRVPFVTTGGLLTDSANWTYTTGSSPNFLLQAANAAHVAAVFRGAASQTANVLECQNSSGTVFLSVASDGSIAQTVTKSGASTTLGTSVAVNFQNTGGFNRAAIFVGTSNPSSASTAAVIGFEARADLAGNATVFTSGSLIGVSAQIRINSGTASGTLPSGFGVRSIVDNQNSSVTLTNGYGYWASTPTRTGAITNYFAFYTEALTSADYAFYSAGTGRVYIGDTTNSTSAGTGALLLNGGIGLADAKDISFGTTTGTKIGTSTSQKIGFFNATPIVQPASANQAALTDSTTGTPSTTLVDAGAAYSQANINNNFASVARLLNQLRSDLVSLGLIKGAA